MHKTTLDIDLARKIIRRKLKNRERQLYHAKRNRFDAYKPAEVNFLKGEVSGLNSVLRRTKLNLIDADKLKQAAKTRLQSVKTRKIKPPLGPDFHADWTLYSDQDWCRGRIAGINTCRQALRTATTS